MTVVVVDLLAGGASMLLILEQQPKLDVVVGKRLPFFLKTEIPIKTNIW